MADFSTGNNRTIPELLQYLRMDQISLATYLGDLERLFLEKEPEIKAFVLEKNKFLRLHNEAQLLSEKYPKSADRPILFGLPVGVKDIFNISAFPTKAGSRLPAKVFQGDEAVCVSRLKELGAIVFGKTVTTEFAYFAPGPTRNPYNLSHTPGGSSSGSAAAVSAGLVPFAFGTQTIGSIIRPASYCGIVGFKPTYDRISSIGVIPLAPSVDTVGFFTRDLYSTSFMARILVDEWDFNKKSSRKPVLGIPDGPFLENISRKMAVHFKQVWKFLNYKGYTILNIPVMHNFEDIYKHHNVIVAYEAAETHEKWFSEYRNLYHPKSEELVLRGQRISKHAYERSLASRLKLRNKLLEKQKIEGVDLWISPPAQGAAPKGIESTGDPVMNLPWTHCGFPTINIPAGLNTDGLPMGLQVTASWYKDENLLSWGSDLESNFEEFNEEL